MIILFGILLLSCRIKGELSEMEKVEFCENLNCDEDYDRKVCGIRFENEKPAYKWFDNECKLLKHGCQVEGDEAYGMVNNKYCYIYLNQDIYNQTQSDGQETNCTNCEAVGEPVCGIRREGPGFIVRIFENKCQLSKYNCESSYNTIFYITDYFICEDSSRSETDKGLTSANESREIVLDSIKAVTRSKDNDKSIADEENTEKLVDNNTDVLKETNDGSRRINDEKLHKSDTTLNESKDKELIRKARLVLHGDNDNSISSKEIIEKKSSDDNHEVNDEKVPKTETDLPVATRGKIPIELFHQKVKNIIVIKAPYLSMQHVNKTIENFFESTHVTDLRVQEFPDEASRRYFVKIFGPKKVYTPWVVIPKNISEDHWHTPTLASCFHTCPTKCPDTYAPVCGVPGILAREPSLMFQNHCFMDAAQCKMFWDDKSPTAQSSSYIESSFLFCMGYEYSSLYRFLPLLKTLQHMGRLKKKSNFHQKIKNFKFFNEFLRGGAQPKMMG